MAEGSCLCGHIKYRVELFPERTFNCHCKYCRKVHGAAFATLTLADGNTLEIIEGHKYIKEHKNAIGGFRSFCSECGTRLMNYGPDKSKYLSVCLSSIDSEVNFTPVAHVNLESKAAWYEPYDGIACFEGFPPGVAPK